jgi:predicted transcriptional regulator
VKRFLVAHSVDLCSGIRISNYRKQAIPIDMTDEGTKKNPNYRNHDYKEDSGMDYDDIVLQILRSASNNKGIKASEIRKYAKVSSDDLLKEYLDHLMKSGLIWYADRDAHIFKTTYKGTRFLKSHTNIKKDNNNHNSRIR